MKLSTLLFIFLLAVIPWVFNAFKFAECDFESDYKCEIIHGVGVLLPHSSFITVWFDTDT